MIKLLPNGILIGPNVLFWLSYPLFDSNYLVTEPGYAEVTPIHLTRLVPNYYAFLRTLRNNALQLTYIQLFSARN